MARKIELYQVEAPNFMAGYLIENGVCIQAAPILKRFVGLTALECRNSVIAHRWRFWPVFSRGKDSE